MTRRSDGRLPWRDSLAWGAVGTLTVLVAHQTSVLLGATGRSVPLVVALAGVIGLTVAVIARRFGGRMRRYGR